MPIIVKKVLRSMWRSKMAYLACITVITIGIMCYVVLSAVVARLDGAKDAFYKEYNFADCFARVVQAPKNVLSEIEAVEGVKKAGGRLSAISRVITEDKDKIVSLRVYGLDIDTDMKEQINGFKILGEPLTGSKDILVDKPFFDARGLKEGDTLELSVYGIRRLFTVRGAFNSPEYIFTMSENGSLMPEPDAFGTALITAEALENITGQRGVITDIGLLLDDGYEFDQVKNRLEEILSSYGITYLIPRKDQTSHSMLTMELDGVRNMSTGMSGMFLFVAAAILYIMLRRLVEQERTQIGVLKAFGYSNYSIICNYLLYGAATGIVGGFLGACLGAASVEPMYQMYLMYFSIPPAEIPAASGVGAYFVRGVLISAAAGMAAAFLGVRGALSLHPAEAMRPPAPPLINNSIVEGNRLLELLLTKRGLMSLRYMERNKFKSFLIIFSISLSYMIMAIMYSYPYLVDKMMIDQFSKIETYDIKVSLKTPVPKHGAVWGIGAIEGVNYAEPMLELPFYISYENITKSANITGLKEDSAVYRIMDYDGMYYSPPKEGLLMAKKTAEDLGVAAGDTVVVESPYLNEKKELPVIKVIDASLSAGAFMEIDSVSMLLNTQPIANRVLMTSEEGKSAGIKEALINASNIGDVSDKASILKTYEDMLDSYIFMIYVVLIMAILIAFAIIYNISGVSLSERARELATMRVLGYGPKETSEILSFENYILCFFAIAAGIPLTMLAMKGYGQMYDTDLFTFPEKLPAISHLYSALSCLLAVFLSNLAILRSVKKFELAIVLKERE